MSWILGKDIWESQILDDNATFANDPLFSKVALGGYVDKKEAPNQKKQQKKRQELVNVCQLCHKNHDFVSCPECKKGSVE